MLQHPEKHQLRHSLQLSSIQASSKQINLQFRQLAVFDHDTPIDAAVAKSAIFKQEKNSPTDCSCWRSSDRKLDIVAANSLVPKQHPAPKLLQLVQQQQPAPNLPRLVPAHVELGSQRLRQQHAIVDGAETESKLLNK